jgi:hypothetical protein
MQTTRAVRDLRVLGLPTRYRGWVLTRLATSFHLLKRARLPTRRKEALHAAVTLASRRRGEPRSAHGIEPLAS